MYVCMYVNWTSPKVIQSNHMLINNHGYVVPIEHYKVPEVHKTEEDIKASSVYLNRHDMCSDSPNQMMKMAGMTEGDHLNINMVAALFVIMPTYYLYAEINNSKQI